MADSEAAAPTPPPQLGSRRRLPPVLATILAVLAAQIFGLWLAVGFARATYRIGPLDVSIRTYFDWPGRTVVALPPLGRVSAETHRLPLVAELTPDQLRIRSIKDLLRRIEQRKSTQSQVRRDAYAAVRAYALRLGGLAFLGGALGALLVGRRRLRQVAGSGALCVVCAGVLGGVMASQYNARAFRHPHYTGVLSEAPHAIEMVRQGFADFGKVRQQLRNAATNLARTYDELSLATMRPNEESVRLLHVSDLHNNPAGLDLTEALAAGFRVDGVLCSGDFGDWGSRLENRLLAGWRAIPQPKLFVSGNHDSETTMRALAEIPGATLLADGVVIEQFGMRIVGWNDPISFRPGAGEAETPLSEVAALEAKMKAALQALSPPADLVLVHNYRAAEPCAGLARVFCYGHDHRARVAQRGGSWLIDAGTTGASGIRYFTATKRPPFSAAILYFSRPAEERPPALQAVDVIEVREPSGDFTVQRVTPPSAPAGTEEPQ